MRKNARTFSYKNICCFSQTLTKTGTCRHSLVGLPDIEFNKNPFNVSLTVKCAQTDRHDKANRRVFFTSVANASKNGAANMQVSPTVTPAVRTPISVSWMRSLVSSTEPAVQKLYNHQPMLPSVQNTGQSVLQLWGPQVSNLTVPDPTRIALFLLCTVPRACSWTVRLGT
jgi:hypothetical protein